MDNSTVHVLGASVVKTLSVEVAQQIRALHGSCGEREEIVFQINIDGQLYYSSENKRVKKRNTYTIEYKKNGVLKFGLVQYYVFLSHNVLLAVVKEHETLNVTCKDCFQLTSSALDTVSSLGVLHHCV